MFQSLAAGTNGLCNSNTKQKLAIASIKNYYATVPTFSQTIYEITHELGHLMGSPHTHACFWTVNGISNQALDDCDVRQPWEGNCPLVNPPIYPYYMGTIMSYCDDFDFSTGFGEQPGNLIRYKVANATCLQCADIYIIDFKDETVTTDTTITGCEINVQNVNVTNGSKLILNAKEKTTIQKDFSVPVGSRLEIK